MKGPCSVVLYCLTLIKAPYTPQSFLTLYPTVHNTVCFQDDDPNDGFVKSKLQCNKCYPTGQKL